MAIELVDRLENLVDVRRFHGMGAADSLSLRSDNYVRMQRFGRRTTSLPFRRFWGMCGENSCILPVPISVILCRWAVLMLWHAFQCLGLRVFPLFFCLLGGLLVLTTRRRHRMRMCG
jgi:hypothetical protein